MKKLHICSDMDLRIPDKMRISSPYMLLVALAASFFCTAEAQEPSTERFAERYSLLVSRLGADGVGIETLLNAWEAEDSSDVRLYTARFNYYFAKSRSSSVVTKPERKYLGTDPVLHLKDSTGADVYYFQEYSYDDSLFSMAATAIDKAIRMHPERLDIRLMKADGLYCYEKGSPDMTYALLAGLIDEYYSGKTAWQYPDNEVNDEFFKSLVQQYCAMFFNLGTANAYDAFRMLSEKMLEYEKNDTTFMANLGSYMLVAEKNYKGALKWYNKVLKINPSDYAALKNCIITSRQLRNTKLEKKYLSMMASNGTESERQSARIRLNALEKNY